MADIEDIFRPSGPSTMTSERQRIFAELKPRCVALSKCILTAHPDNRSLTAALSDLYPVLKSIPNDQLDQKLGDYIFFPLSHVFRQYQLLGDRAIELAINCLDILVTTCWRVVIEPEAAKQLLILLTFVVGGRPGQKEDGKRSEETKLAGCRCLMHLFSGAGRCIVADVEAMPAVGHTVTTLLETFQGGEMVELQMMALEALQILMMDAVDDADMRASFYPGIVSGLVKALGLGKTTKRNYDVLRAMVKFLERLMASVLNDGQTATLPDEEEENNTLKLRRTKPWVKATAKNTKVALEQILKLRTHPKVEVRTVVFELARSLLESCPRTLEEATTILVETLVVIAGDIDESLASLAENTIRVMALMTEDIKDAVKGCLDRWIVGLPRVMTGNDEDAKQRVITRLSIAFGLCTELGMESDLLRDMLADGIKDSLLAVNASSKSQAMVRATPVQPRLQMLLTDRTNISSAGRIAKFPDVLIGQRSQMNTMESMKQLLSSLGRSSENGLSLAQRHIRDASARNSSTDERVTSFWIAINLLKDTLNESNEMDLYLDYGLLEVSPLQRHVTDELLALALANLTTSVEDETESAENATMHCLALEALSLVAETHKSHFRGELVDALYPVVHHLGSYSPEVQNHAIVALNNIASACEYSSAKELILDNVDYMVNAVSLKLNIFDLSPQAPVVLMMLLKLVGARLVPFLDDLVVSIFSILEGFGEYERLCEELFKVLGAIVEESAKGDESAKRITAPPEDRQPKRRKVMQDSDFLEFLRASRNADRPRLDPLDDSPPSDDEGEESSFPEKPWGKPKPKNEDVPLEDDDNDPPPRTPSPEPPKPSQTYTIVQRITRLSQHYLTATSFSLRARVLHLVTTSAPTLATNTSEYLPVINDLWPVLFTRLSDSEPGVVIAACAAISALAETSGDFLRSRVGEGWPGIRRVFDGAKRKLEEERRVRTMNMGVFGVNYKVWVAVCGMLESLVRWTGVGEEIVDEIVEMMGSEGLRERPTLREALEEVAPEAVWVEMMRGERWKGDCPKLEGVVFDIPMF